MVTTRAYLILKKKTTRTLTKKLVSSQKIPNINSMNNVANEALHSSVCWPGNFGLEIRCEHLQLHCHSNKKGKIKNSYIVTLTGYCTFLMSLVGSSTFLEMKGTKVLDRTHGMMADGRAIGSAILQVLTY